MSEMNILFVIVGFILVLCSAVDIFTAKIRGKSVSESVDRRSYPLQKILKGRRGNDIANA